MIVEVGTAVTPRGVLEGLTLEFRGAGSFYAETALIPGFSDAHAHPQVVDYGSGGKWSNAYEWLTHRRLKVDEAKLRADTEFSARLALLAMWRSLLEGCTMIAMVGSYYANLRAVETAGVRPRAVVMPTLLEAAPGWWSLRDLLGSYDTLARLDGYVRPGVFVHSVRLVRTETLKRAYALFRKAGLPFSLHLSEGVPELEELARALGLKRGEDSRIVAVHCCENEDYAAYGVRVVHCPSSNLLLYGKTLSRVELVSALGSDWPLLLGGVYSAYKEAVKYHGRQHAWRLIRAATIGGYEIYGLPWKGDAVFFDDSLEKVIEGLASPPKYVAVGGEFVVTEGELAEVGLSLSDVERLSQRAVKEALEKYGVG